LYAFSPPNLLSKVVTSNLKCDDWRNSAYGQTRECFSFSALYSIVLEEESQDNDRYQRLHISSYSTDLG
jgi:hypothetical protein